MAITDEELEMLAECAKRPTAWRLPLFVANGLTDILAERKDLLTMHEGYKIQVDVLKRENARLKELLEIALAGEKVKPSPDEEL